MGVSESWDKIFDDYQILKHDFKKSPFEISAKQIKQSCQAFTETNQKEVRILCKQDTRESRPDVFIKNNLFLLPKKNGFYYIINGEGYVDIPDIVTPYVEYSSKLGFELETSSIGNSEMQHLDFAYASSIIRTFMNDDSLVLTIRGRKFTPPFDFFIGNQCIKTESVQTEVDAGYEGKDQIVLVEAKNTTTKNTIIRQLFYPYKQWQLHSKKKVFLLFFEKRVDGYYIWQYGFKCDDDYNSIHLNKSARYRMN